MKILYSIQATGNGHVSRAAEIAPYLEKYGEVDYLLSGTNCSLRPDFKVTYRFNGLSLFYNNIGGISINKIWHNNSFVSVAKNAYNLPVEKYDLIINDFDFITALSCKIKKVKSVHFGHQASFQSENVPRPDKKKIAYEFLLKHFAEATHHVGLHFKPYDQSIFNPIIKQELLDIKPDDKGHITIYLPSIKPSVLLPFLEQNPNTVFHLFCNERKVKFIDKNVHFMPIDALSFSWSMLNCHGVITGGGFETPSEALFLGKKLISYPIKNHYEQHCNAAALKQLGVQVEENINDDFGQKLYKWINSSNSSTAISPNNISVTLDHVFNIGVR